MSLPGQVEAIADKDGRVTPLWYEFFQDGDAWTKFTPTVTPSSGAFTSVSATGRYKRSGRTVLISMNIVITTNGTGAGSVIASLPFVGGVSLQVVNGIVTGAANFGIFGAMGSNGAALTILKYDGTYPGSSGSTLILNGVLEAK